MEASSYDPQGQSQGLHTCSPFLPGEGSLCICLSNEFVHIQTGPYTGARSVWPAARGSARAIRPTAEWTNARVIWAAAGRTNARAIWPAAGWTNARTIWNTGGRNTNIHFFAYLEQQRGCLSELGC